MVIVNSENNESEAENLTSCSQTESSSAGNNSKYSGESFEEDDDDGDEVSFDISCMQHSICQGARNKTFSPEKLRDIERTNGILMNKILSNNKRVNQYTVAPKTTKLKTVSSAAINRKRNQEKIARDNQMLLKKIQSVKPSVIHK
ncbi:hypothetical protein NQ315_016541 [Exocentrus adspersus]|uniref:Cilia- and flagella-associated protein 97-like n=1 Tax=Exocentrus adspersus TaxID=1586481 RepID=A0AAV8VYZ5_9CUCU|nr:hypothetical protein NQ315_016541 [Exocentrus adspersus]